MKLQSVVRTAHNTAESNPDHLATQSIAEEALEKGNDQYAERDV